MQSATRVFVSTFGAFMALGGIEHGIGEILQGNVTSGGVMIQSWPESEFFRSLGGEPAMTLIPNLLVTGILAVLVSLALLLWSVLFVHRKRGGLVMILLSGAMLLVGGGIFPPIFSALVGVVATRIRSTLTWRRGRPSEGVRRFLARLWPWSYAVCMAAWLAVLPGIPLIESLFGVDDLAFILGIMSVALVMFPLAILAGLAYDAGLARETAGAHRLRPGRVPEPSRP